MFLSRFARHRRRRRSRRRCRHRPQTFVHAITFEQLFGFLSFFANCWFWPIDYLIWVWSIFVVTLTLNFQGQIRNLLYPSQNDPIATKLNANVSIELKASNVTIGCDLGRDLGFSGSIMEFSLSQPQMVRLPLNEEETYRFKFRPQIWPSSLTLAVTLTVIFLRSDTEFAISQAKVIRRSGVRIYQIVTGWLLMSACRRLIYFIADQRYKVCLSFLFLSIK